MAYNRQVAINYARKYALSSNSAYPTARSDCTNFVSQCLFEAGWAMIGGSADGGDRELYNVWWYGKRTGWYFGENWSWTWANADYFAKFLQISKRAAAVRDASTLDLGDVIQIANSSRIHHSMIVTGKTGGELKLSYHSSAHLDAGLGEVASRVAAKGEELVYWKLAD